MSSPLASASSTEGRSSLATLWRNVASTTTCRTAPGWFEARAVRAERSWAYDGRSSSPYTPGSRGDLPIHARLEPSTTKTAGAGWVAVLGVPAGTVLTTLLPVSRSSSSLRTAGVGPPELKLLISSFRTSSPVRSSVALTCRRPFVSYVYSRRKRESSRARGTA